MMLPVCVIHFIIFMILFTLLFVTAATCHGSDSRLIVGCAFCSMDTANKTVRTDECVLFDRRFLLL